MRYLAFILIFIATPLYAVQPDEVLDDAALELRARDLSKELRCLVCRNENIDESNAGLARDLRLLVRERLVIGDTDAEVLQYMVDRFGEYVLLRPRFSLSNTVLWLAGPGFLLAGGFLAWMFVRRKPDEDGLTELSAAEQERLDQLLKD